MVDSKWSLSYCEGWLRPYFSRKIGLLSCTRIGSLLHACTEWGIWGYLTRGGSALHLATLQLFSALRVANLPIALLTVSACCRLWSAKRSVKGAHYLRRCRGLLPLKQTTSIGFRKLSCLKCSTQSPPRSPSAAHSNPTFSSKSLHCRRFRFNNFNNHFSSSSSFHWEAARLKCRSHRRLPSR